MTLTDDTRGLIIADRSPDFRELGFRAATLFADHLGIDCDLCLINACDPFEATRAKLSEVTRRTQTHNVLFCDADLWLVRRPADIEVPTDIDESFVCAVADPSPRHPGASPSTTSTSSSLTTSGLSTPGFFGRAGARARFSSSRRDG